MTGDKVIFYLGLSYLLVYLLSYFLKEKPFNQSDKQEFEKKKITSFCILTMLTGLVNWILSVSDQLLIEQYYGLEALAPYAVVFRMVSLIALCSSIFLSYYPVMYFKDMDANKSSEILLFRRLFIFFLIAAALLMQLFVTQIFYLFGAENYLTNTEYFYWLIGGEVLRLIASILMTYRTYRLQQNYIFIIVASVSVINIVLNVVLLPLYGPLVAAKTTVFCYLLYFIVAYVTSYLPERAYIRTKLSKGS